MNKLDKLLEGHGKLIENHEKAMNLLLRNQKILAENHSDLERQMDVEVQHLQRQIDALSVSKKSKKDKKGKKDKKAGKKEKKEKKQSDSSDDDLKLASWRDQRMS